MIDLTHRQHTTFESLQRLVSAPGQIEIHLHVLNDQYVPFVFFITPDDERTGLGPILSDGNMVASEDLDDLVAALSETFGAAVKIYTTTRGPSPTRSYH
jgi:hypothetical protein